MKRPSLRFLISRKFWQHSAFTLACLATLIVAAYEVEKYRGEKAWSDYRAEAEARGAKLDLKDFIPPPIPDEENFAAIPIYRELLSRDRVVRERARKACAIPLECRPYVANGEPLDFPALGKCMVESALLPATTDDAPADVLRALEYYEPVLAQMRAAVARPGSRLDSEWEKGLNAAFWEMSNVLDIGKLISLRVSALVAKDRGHEALIDWRVGFRHAGVFAGEPTLLACMLRVMLIALLADNTSRELAAHPWSEDELRTISSDLATIDLTSDFVLGMSSERAFRNEALDRMKVTSGIFTALQIGDPAKPPKWSWDILIPRGWFAQNQRHLNEWGDEQVAMAIAAQASAAIEISLPQFEIPQSWWRLPYWFVVRTSAYPMGGNLRICREVQTNVDLCLVACALERFRLRNGDFPKELRDLVPDTLSKLPRDRFDGQALRYRRTDGGGVILYSAGRDCRDDGGDDAKDSVLRLRPVTPAARKF